MTNIYVDLWKVSLGITSIFGHGIDFEILNKYKNFWSDVSKNKIKMTQELTFGILSTNSNLVIKSYNDRAEKFLGRVCRVFNKDDMKTRLEEYLSGTFNIKTFDKKRNFLKSLTPKDRISFIDSLKNNKYDHVHFSVINQYDKFLPPSGILAFDLSNYTSMCRLGGYLGYLDENEVLKYLERSALMAQKNYSSFMEFSISSMIGIILSQERYKDDYQQVYIERLKEILTNPVSYFTNLNWNQSLH